MTLSEHLSPSAAKIIEGSLSKVNDPDQLKDIDKIVRTEIGGLSLTLGGDALEQTAGLQRVLIEIVNAHIRSLAENRFASQPR